MTRALTKLSVAPVKNHGLGKYSAGGGLWLHQRSEDGAQWFLREVVHGRRGEKLLGNLTHASLKQAREGATKWRHVARKGKGKDPNEERERLRRAVEKADHRRETIALEAVEAHKTELKGDGMAGRWFSPLEPLELFELQNLGASRSRCSIGATSRIRLLPFLHARTDAAR